MAKGKPIGNVVGFITIIAIIVGVGIFFLLFAACYKFVSDGTETWDLLQYCRRKNESESRQPEPSSTVPPPPAAPPSTTGRANHQSTATDPQSTPTISVSLPREAPETKETDIVVSEVAAIVIPVHMKVSKQGREIVTPRAIPLGPVKIAVEATPYESDIESQRTVIEVTNNRNRATRASQGSTGGSAAALDRRAPDWYNDLNEVDDDIEAAANPATRRGSANTTGAAASARTATTRTSQTQNAVVMDHRAPTWYDD